MIHNKSIAKVVADSITSDGKRLTTLSLKYWRPIHPEFMTHRMFSRNAQSSRARPVEQTIKKIQEGEVWGPIEWGKNQKGMVAKETIPFDDQEKAESLWLGAAKRASETAMLLSDLNVHKQVVNRLLEPYTSIEVLVTATEWDNFFKLRLAPDAQPEIQDLARAMKEAMDNSEPVLLKTGDWHLPFVDPEEEKDHLMTTLILASVARCARVSYVPFGSTTKDISRDLKLTNTLYHSGHFSPFEHIATPMIPDLKVDTANLRGWLSLRSCLNQDLFISLFDELNKDATYS